MGWLTVVEPGMLTTVQDLGRVGHAGIGVPTGGAFDALSLRAGNRLVGNDDGAAGLECTLIGPTLRFEQEAVIAVAGSQTPTNDPAPWTRLSIQTGATVRIGSISGGARAYVSIAGGISVPQRLGSASTLLSAGFGGHLGRALKAGDRLEFNSAPARTRDTRLASDLMRANAQSPETRVIRAVDGPHPHAFNPTVTDAFWNATFRVSNQSNRAGVRLDGPTFSTRVHGDMVSEGSPVGAIEITPSGQPIALGVDGPTTGGYPVIACICTVDLHLLGQARPGEKLRFQRVTLKQAREALIDRESDWQERAR